MFFKKKKETNIAFKIYQKIMNFSRDKIFYTKFLVPDTIDGRFDTLTLLVVIIVYRLSLVKENGSTISQLLFDMLFQDLDYSLREMGAGDAAVTKNMRKFVSSYMGRQKVYINAFKDNNFKKLEISIINNIFRNTKVNKQVSSLFTKKILDIHETLSSISDDDILRGNFDFTI